MHSPMDVLFRAAALKSKDDKGDDVSASGGPSVAIGR